MNYSHEYVTFWYVWNIRTTNFEILIRTSFSQMSNFRRVKNSHVFVTTAKIRSNFSRVWQISANSSYVWQIRSNVKVKRICHKCEKFERICHTYEEFVRIFHRCDKYVQINHFCEGLARIFISVIRTHDMCDKFIKKSICSAFIFTVAYLPKHNTVLWKEIYWGDIRLFLRRLGIGRTRR